MIQHCCAAGEIHTGTPAGRVEKVHGVDCYIASPPAGTRPKGVIVNLPDVFGWELVNARILADSYAHKGGFLVYLPEMQAGKALPVEVMSSIHALEAPGLVAALTRAYHFARVLSWWAPFAYTNTAAAVRSRLYPFMAALRRHEARHLPLGLAGFCWGGYWAFQLAHDLEADRVDVDAPKKLPLVDAVFTAHPSLMRVPEDIEAVRKPTSVAAAEHDMRYPRDKVELTREVLERKQEDEGVRHELVWYEGCHHGWAVRGSKTDPKEGEKGLQAEEQALKWFESRFAEVRDDYAAA